MDAHNLTHFTPVFNFPPENVFRAWRIIRDQWNGLTAKV